MKYLIKSNHTNQVNWQYNYKIRAPWTSRNKNISKVIGRVMWKTIMRIEASSMKLKKRNRIILK